MFAVVGLSGGLIAWLRRHRRPVKGRAVALIAAASLVVGAGLTRRERTGLVLLGLIGLAAFASFFTSPSMFLWLID